MNLHDMATALRRVEAVLQRRPGAGVHEDPAAVAHWEDGGGGVVATHPNGLQLRTDIPKELGGPGEQVAAGWLLRAGLASCATASIVLKAAAHGVELTSVEVRVEGRSDVRGILGMVDEKGDPVSAGPVEMRLSVRIGASGASAAALRSVVEEGVRCSPVSSTVRNAVPLALSIQIDSGGA